MNTYEGELRINGYVGQPYFAKMSCNAKGIVILNLEDREFDDSYSFKGYLSKGSSTIILESTEDAGKIVMDMSKEAKDLFKGRWFEYDGDLLDEDFFELDLDSDFESVI